MFYGAKGTFRYLLLLLSYYEYEGASKDTYEGTRDHAKIAWGAVWLKSRAIEGNIRSRHTTHLFSPARRFDAGLSREGGTPRNTGR